MKDQCGLYCFLGGVIALTSLFLPYSSSATTILNETFESAFPSANGWQVGDDNPAGQQAFWSRVKASFGWQGAHGGDWKGYCAGVGHGGKSTRPSYQNNMHAYMERPVNLVSYSSATLTFWYKIKVEDGRFDKLRLLVNYKQIWKASTPQNGHEWQQVTLSLDEFAGQGLTLSFVFTSSSNGVEQGAYLDDIVVEGTLLPGADPYEPDNSSYDAKTIGNGEKQNRSIFRDCDFGKFSLPYGASNVWIETDGPVGDTMIELRGPDDIARRVPGGQDNDDGNGSFSLLVSGQQGMPASLWPGTYYIYVDELNYEAIPAYTLSASWADNPPSSPAPDIYEPDNKAANAPYIFNGKRQRRNIHKAGNTDWAYFTTEAGGATNIVIETDGAAGDTQLWLYGPNSASEKVAYDDDSGSGRFSKITCSNLPSGFYYIKIQEQGSNGTIPAYSLRAAWQGKNNLITPDLYEPDNTQGKAKSISNGELQHRNIHETADIDYVKFTVGPKGAEKVVIENSDASGQMRVISYSGKEVAYVEDPSDDGSLRITLPGLSAGTYTIVVEAFRVEPQPIPAYSLRARWINL